jgi:L,D-transpeptidase catalytic domain
MFRRGRLPLKRGCCGLGFALAVLGTSLVSAPVATARSAPRAHVRLYLPDAFFVSRQAVTVPKRLIHVGGVVTPYVPGQRAAVRIFLGHHMVKRATVAIRPSRNRRYGHFRQAFSSPGVGGVSIVVDHRATAKMGGFEGRRSLAALDEHVGFGSTGRFVELIQQRLAALHFFLAQTGVYDAGTGMAIDAYHRLLHRGTSPTLDGVTSSYLLDGFGAFRLRFPRHGRHAEVDLSLQLLALADGARVEEIVPTSSGKPSTPTVEGHFRIYERQPGYNAKLMYYSDFFTGNYAIHGYDPAPDYPASHGCVRIPIADAIPVFNWFALGDWVDVYT